MENTAMHQSAYKKATAAIMLAGAAAFSMEYCLQPVISRIAATFALSAAQASLPVSAAMFGMALTLLALTAFADRLPRRKLLTASLIVSSLVMSGIVFTASFYAVVALVPVLAMAYVNEEFGPQNVSAGIGMYVCGTTLGGLSGRILASILTDFFSWQVAVAILSIIAALIGILVYILLPYEQHALKKQSSGFSTEVFSKENKNLFYLCAAAFCMIGSFVAVYNFIAYVLINAPYNLSQSVIGFLFAVQLFGTFSSALAGRLGARYSARKTIAAFLALLAFGAILTLHEALIIKIDGLSILTIGLFGAHSSACGWSASLIKNGKAAAGSLYMFCYYSGASILGSLGGVFYARLGWHGVVFMSAAAALLALGLLSCIIQHNQKTQI